MENCDCDFNSVNCACNKPKAVKAQDDGQLNADLYDVQGRIMKMYETIKHMFI